MLIDLEQNLRQILADRGYTLGYKETFPSNSEDMYEFEAWFEDRELNRYPFHKIYVRNIENKSNFNYKNKALKILLNIIMESYFDDIIKKKDEIS